MITAQQTFKNLKVIQDRNILRLKFKKKYEPGMFLFLFVFYGFIVGMFFLMDYSQETNPPENPNFFLILKSILLFIGVVVSVGTTREILKRESIEIDQTYISLVKTIAKRRVDIKQFDLKLISELKVANPSEKGWRKLNHFEDGSSTESTYQYKTSKIYPTISFQYKGEEVLFAEGLKPNEANEVIAFIKKYIANEN